MFDASPLAPNEKVHPPAKPQVIEAFSVRVMAFVIPFGVVTEFLAIISILSVPLESIIMRTGNASTSVTGTPFAKVAVT